MGNIFNIILVYPITNVLVAIYQGLLYVHIPYALGFAIMLLTVLIRIILLPLTASQLRASKKMQELTPHISKLKEKHKNDAKTLQAEQMKLYKEHGVNPAAGCIPAVIQLPIIFALYAVLRQIVNVNPKTGIATINKILYIPSLHLHGMWDQHFFGLPLGQSPSKLLHSYGILIFLIPIVTAGLQLLQSRMMFAVQPKPAPTLPEKNKKGKELDKIASDKAAAPKQDDFAQVFQTQSLFMLPIIIGYSSFAFPAGISLYWNTFTIFGIIQQYMLQGWGGLQPWIDKVTGKIYG